MHGKKIGRELLHTAMHYDRYNKIESVVLDTDSKKALKAIELFKAAGFLPISPYKETPHSDLFMKVDMENYECPFCTEAHL